ncbi:energy-coupling factor ABC transporter ATP-binding protein [Pelotomaculum isophthalicicum JI]|uniref:Energy-coupling factor ABC transporter ATP-binding protein n=1 Tax=Pelotomaculum isophthalicicum JI TaxID=947010 RepID=A0A9X4JWD7_9FIRM|nr:ABC transporter ATP-binding protein [Pelotomaculum isophthalicicum]MDF9409027.1 energy-coupling factor ABC transporter ATP-binding protein [Pelotomaculum isophthalicicum JI]
MNDINLSILKEGITAVTGSNGSGKTTFSKLLTGILTPTKGCVKLNGQLLTSLSLAQIGRQVGYVFQNPEKQLFCETVEEEISFGMHNLGFPLDQVALKTRDIMEYFELTRYSQSFPHNLSAGEKRRLAIAAVIALEPDLLILDEPTTGLDPYRKKLLGDYMERIIASNRGVVIISHDHKFIDRYATRLIRLREGQFTEG